MNKCIVAVMAIVTLNSSNMRFAVAEELKTSTKEPSNVSAKESEPDPAKDLAKEPVINKTAKDWQVKSLKGITLIKYGVAYDPGNQLTRTVTSELSGTGVTLKSVSVKLDSETPLSSKEARLKIVVDRRHKDKSWVGLFVQQKSKLDRDSSITYDAETYKIGTLCESANANDTVKELCEQFARDFSRSNGK